MNKKNYSFSALNAWLNERNDFYLILPHQPKLDQVAAICSSSEIQSNLWC